MLISLLLFFAVSARGAECPKITLFAELHSTDVVPLWLRLIGEAERGECLAVFEGFARSINDSPRLKAAAIGHLAPSRNGYANVFGMDSNELKGLSIAGSLYLVARAGARDPDLENALHGLLQEPGMAVALRQDPSLRKWKSLLEPLNAHRFQLRLTKLAAPEVMEFGLRLHAAFVRLAHAAGLAFEPFDLPGYTEGVEAFADAVMPLRDAFMVQSLEQIACADVLRRPLKVSLGLYHVPGVARELKRVWPGIEPEILGVNVGK